MSKPESSKRQNNKSKAQELFLRADAQWDRGDLKAALRTFLAAAKAGDKGAQLNAGYFYDRGLGVQRDRSKALYWYRRAYRRGDGSAAANIATIWRDERCPDRALTWFRRALKLGDDGSNLQIAKYYLQDERTRNKAIAHLERVCKSNRVSEDEKEEAARLLSGAKKKTS